MASLLKPWIIRYLDGEGHQVRKGTPGARKVKVRASKWYGQFTDADGKRRRVPLCADKVAARQLLANLEREIQRGNAGLVDPFAKHRTAPIAQHIVEYETHLRNKEVNGRYLKEHLRRLRLVLEHGKVRTLGQLRADVVESYLAMLLERKTGPSMECKTGATMRNKYLDSAKAFTKWCVANRRISEDPLAHLKRVAGEQRRNRRALSEEELIRLLKAARERPLLDMRTVRSGSRKGEKLEKLKRPETEARMEELGWERSLIYKTLVLTGLRRGELEALEVKHLMLTGPRPCLAIPGSVTKNGKPANLPLRADLVEDLRSWLKTTGKSGSDRVFKVIKNLYKVLRADLDWAGIPYRDAQGRTIDVHALRHTTASHLARAKVAPRVAQGFMRHADIKLTMQTYTDASLLDEAEALAALPALPLSGDEKTAGDAGPGPASSTKGAGSTKRSPKRSGRSRRRGKGGEPAGGRGAGRDAGGYQPG